MLDVHGSVLRGLQHNENGNKIVGLGPTPGDLPDPGMEPASLVSPALAGGFFTIVPPGKPHTLTRTGKRKKIDNSKC